MSEPEIAFKIEFKIAPYPDNFFSFFSSYIATSKFILRNA